MLGWTNKNIYKLKNDTNLKGFLERNKLKCNSTGFDVINIYNSNCLIKIFEERDYLHSIYYNLNDIVYYQEMYGIALRKNIPNLEDRKKLYTKFQSNVKDNTILKEHLMSHFYFLLYVIETYMQDFLNNDFSIYDCHWKKISGKHKNEITMFKQNFTGSA